MMHLKTAEKPMAARASVARFLVSVSMRARTSSISLAHACPPF